MSVFIEKKFFSKDKNYLLKSVQAFAKESLLNLWFQQIIFSYNIQHNPMHLEDDFVIDLKKRIHFGKALMDDNYDLLAAIYRHDHADNQLEIMWDGRLHMEAYDTDWKAMYTRWIESLSLIKEIQRPIIKYALSEKGIDHRLLRQAVKRAILSYFGMKIQSKKICRMQAA